MALMPSGSQGSPGHTMPRLSSARMAEVLLMIEMEADMEEEEEERERQRAVRGEGEGRGRGEERLRGSHSLRKEEEAARAEAAAAQRLLRRTGAGAGAGAGVGQYRRGGSGPLGPVGSGPLGPVGWRGENSGTHTSELPPRALPSPHRSGPLSAVDARTPRALPSPYSSGPLSAIDTHNPRGSSPSPSSPLRSAISRRGPTPRERLRLSLEQRKGGTPQGAPQGTPGVHQKVGAHGISALSPVGRNATSSPDCSHAATEERRRLSLDHQVGGTTPLGVHGQRDSLSGIHDRDQEYGRGCAPGTPRRGYLLQEHLSRVSPLSRPTVYPRGDGGADHEPAGTSHSAATTPGAQLPSQWSLRGEESPRYTRGGPGEVAWGPSSRGAPGVLPKSASVAALPEEKPGFDGARAHQEGSGGVRVRGHGGGSYLHSGLGSPFMEGGDVLRGRDRETMQYCSMQYTDEQSKDAGPTVPQTRLRNSTALPEAGGWEASWKWDGGEPPHPHSSLGRKAFVSGQQQLHSGRPGPFDQGPVRSGSSGTSGSSGRVQELRSALPARTNSLDLMAAGHGPRGRASRRSFELPERHEHTNPTLSPKATARAQAPSRSGPLTPVLHQSLDPRRRLDLGSSRLGSLSERGVSEEVVSGRGEERESGDGGEEEAFEEARDEGRVYRRGMEGEKEVKRGWGGGGSEHKRSSRPAQQRPQPTPSGPGHVDEALSTPLPPRDPQEPLTPARMPGGPQVHQSPLRASPGARQDTSPGEPGVPGAPGVPSVSGAQGAPGVPGGVAVRSSHWNKPLPNRVLEEQVEAVLAAKRASQRVRDAEAGRGAHSRSHSPHHSHSQPHSHSHSHSHSPPLSPSPSQARSLSSYSHSSSGPTASPVTSPLPYYNSHAQPHSHADPGAMPGHVPLQYTTEEYSTEVYSPEPRLRPALVRSAPEDSEQEVSFSGQVPGMPPESQHSEEGGLSTSFTAHEGPSSASSGHGGPSTASARLEGPRDRAVEHRGPGTWLANLLPGKAPEMRAEAARPRAAYKFGWGGRPREGVGRSEEERPRAAYKLHGGGVTVGSADVTVERLAGRAQGLAEEPPQGYAQGFDLNQCVPLSQPDRVTVVQTPSLNQKTSEHLVSLHGPTAEGPEGAQGVPQGQENDQVNTGHAGPGTALRSAVNAGHTGPGATLGREVSTGHTGPGAMLGREVSTGHTGPGAMLGREVSTGHTGAGTLLRSAVSTGHTGPGAIPRSEGSTGAVYSPGSSGVQTWPEAAVPGERLAVAMGKSGVPRVSQGSGGGRGGPGCGEDRGKGPVYSDTREREAGGSVYSDREGMGSVAGGRGVGVRSRSAREEGGSADSDGRETEGTYSDKERRRPNPVPKHMIRDAGVQTWPEAAVPGMALTASLAASLDGHMQRANSMVSLGHTHAGPDGAVPVPPGHTSGSAGTDLGPEMSAGGFTDPEMDSLLVNGAHASHMSQVTSHKSVLTDAGPGVSGPGDLSPATDPLLVMERVQASHKSIPRGDPVRLLRARSIIQQVALSESHSDL